MIKRYTTPEMEKIFSEENKYMKWLLVEKEVARAQEQEKIIPEGLYKCLEKVKSVSVDRVKFYEERTNHEMTAFLEAVWEKVPCAKKYLHFGLTSQDVMDTANVLIVREAGKVIKKVLNKLLEKLKMLSLQYRNVVCIGRTHGRAAEPYSLGVRFLSWFLEGERVQKRIDKALKNFSYAKIRGVVGTYSLIPPSVEEKVLKKLGLKREPVSTQVIPRDRYIDLLHSVAMAGVWLERIAVNIRLSQIEEVDELHEPFKEGQTGSSAMPHKKNPVICERISGLARVLRGYLLACYENNALWFERDISHSSVERIVIKDSFTLLHYMLRKMEKIIEGLKVNKDKIDENLKKAGDKIFSQLLLSKLIQKGMDRETAYRIVQQNSFYPDFKIRVQKDREIRKYLKKDEIKEIFSLERFLKHIDYIYKKAGVV